MLRAIYRLTFALAVRLARLMFSWGRVRLCSLGVWWARLVSGNVRVVTFVRVVVTRLFSVFSAGVEARLMFSGS